MTKKSSTKRALIVSVIALCLCFTMLVGSTYAWFTDSVSSTGNIIKTGKLDIDMMWADGDEDPAKADWKDASKGAIFNSQLWEPGYTEARHINIINKGTLALKYQLLIEPTGEVTDLANVIDVYFIKDGEQITRDGLKAYKPVGTLAKLIKDGIAFGSLTAGDNRVFTIVLKMQESAGNEYQEKEIGTSFAIKLLATQLASEKDSFGPDYDKDAWHPEMEVYSANDLQSAINNGKTNIVLMADIESAETLSIPEGATVTLNLNGKKLSGAGVDAEGKVHTLVNNGTLTLENGTVSSKGTNGGSAIYNNGVLAMENVTVYGAPSDTATGTASYAVNTQGANSKLTITNSNITGRGAVGATKGTKVEINGGNYYTPAVAWGHAVYADGEGTEVVINGGTFSEGWDYAANLWGMYQIYSGNKAKVTINGGDFSQQWDCANGYDLCTATEGVIEINGGFFAENPSSQNGKNFVADGFKVVENGDGTYAVIFPQESFDNLIDNAQPGDTVNVPAGEYTFPASKLEAGMTLNCAPGTVFEGQSKLNINGATVIGATFSNPTGVAADQTINGTFKNCTFTGKSALRWCYGGDTVVFENCTFNATSVYAIHFDGLTGKNASFINCEITGWVAIAGGANSLTFDGCTINGNGTYGLIRSYSNATIKNCTFDVDNVNTTDAYQDGIHAVGCTVIVENCTNVNGKTDELFNISYDDGKIVYEGVAYVATAGQLAAALKNGDDVALSGDVLVADSETGSNGYGKTGISILNGSTFDGNGNSVGVNAWGTWDTAINTTGGTIKNLTVNSGMRGIFINHNGTAGKVYLENVVIDGTIYTISCDQGTNSGLEATNCTFNGWTSYAATLGDAKFVNCSFGEGQGYAYCRPYSSTEFVGCDFAEGFEFDASYASVTFKNCTIGGVALTAENISDLVVSGENNVTVQ